MDLMRGQDLGVGAQDDRGESRKIFGAEKTAGQTEGMIEVLEGMGVMIRSDLDEEWHRKLIFWRIAMRSSGFCLLVWESKKQGEGAASGGICIAPGRQKPLEQNVS